jgi:hypothetical protein
MIGKPEKHRRHENHPDEHVRTQQATNAQHGGTLRRQKNEE